MNMGDEDMTTAEIEKLYIDAAPDFRELLGVGGFVIAKVGGGSLVLHSEELGWWTNHIPTGKGYWLAPEVAVAVVTEAWWERLEKEHGAVFNLASGFWWANLPIGPQMTDIHADSLPKLIVYCVKALAKAKRGQAQAAILPNVFRGVGGSAGRIAASHQGEAGMAEKHDVGNLAVLVASLANRCAELEAKAEARIHEIVREELQSQQTRERQAMAER